MVDLILIGPHLIISKGGLCGSIVGDGGSLALVLILHRRGRETLPFNNHGIHSGPGAWIWALMVATVAPTVQPLAAYGHFTAGSALQSAKKMVGKYTLLLLLLLLIGQWGAEFFCGNYFSYGNKKLQPSVFLSTQITFKIFANCKKKRVNLENGDFNFRGNLVNSLVWLKTVMIFLNIS